MEKLFAIMRKDFTNAEKCKAIVRIEFPYRGNYKADCTIVFPIVDKRKTALYVVIFAC